MKNKVCAFCGPKDKSLVSKGAGITRLFTKYFDSKKDRLKTTLKKAHSTPYGKSLKLNGLSYKAFRQLPIVVSSGLIKDPYFFVTKDKNLIDISTSGSTSRPKRVFYSEHEFIVPIEPPLLNAIHNSRSFAFLYLMSQGAGYAVASRTLKNARKDITEHKVSCARDFLTAIQNHDSMYILHRVSSFKVLIYELNKLYEKSPSLFKSNRCKEFFLEITAEPVSIAELEEWTQFFKKLCLKINITATYAQTETLGIGIYEYNSKDKEVLYHPLEPKFVEVLNDKNEPVWKGKIIVTPLRKRGSMFIRYDTGDEGEIEFLHGKPHLKNVKRRTSQGMISVLGHKIFVPDIVRIFTDTLKAPAQITAKTLTLGEKTIFEIGIFSPIRIDKQKIALLNKRFRRNFPTVGKFERMKLLTFRLKKNENPNASGKAWRMIKE